MKDAPRLPGRLRPLFALLMVVAGWALSHQLGSISLFDRCAATGGAFVSLVSLAGLALSAGGGLYAYSAAQRGAEPGESFFLMVVAVLAVLAGFAIALQIIAGVILPACAG